MQRLESWGNRVSKQQKIESKDTEKRKEDVGKIDEKMEQLLRYYGWHRVKNVFTFYF